MKNKIFIKLSILLPLVFLVGSWAHMEYQLKTNPKYIVPITGFDPRDLLQGHYIQYKIKWNVDQDKLNSFQEEMRLKEESKPNKLNYFVQAYLCIVKKDNDIISYPMVSKTSSKDCLAVIKGQTIAKPLRAGDEFTFINNTPRFYVPENMGEALSKLITTTNAQISFIVNGSHDIIVNDLLIDGKPWKEAVLSSGFYP